mmetsp:Transcript_38277/g.113791  ORF Transcript_38277/g.113791 Transcript_38277/m.113791 type:complete len:257 (-) Transcript_38277:128-898(-)
MKDGGGGGQRNTVLSARGPRGRGGKVRCCAEVCTRIPRASRADRLELDSTRLGLCSARSNGRHEHGAWAEVRRVRDAPNCFGVVVVGVPLDSEAVGLHATLEDDKELVVMLRRLKLLLLGILDCVSRVGRAVDALAVARAVVRRLLAAPDLEALAHDAAHDARPRARAVIHDRPARLLLQPFVAGVLVLDGQGELRPSLRRQILASATLLMRELLRFLPGVPEIILLLGEVIQDELATDAQDLAQLIARKLGQLQH